MNPHDIQESSENDKVLTEKLQININFGMRERYPSAEEIVEEVKNEK